LAKKSSISYAQPWKKIETGPTDWARVSVDWLLSTTKQARIIRAFEETLLRLSAENLVNGPMHSSIGQEGAAAASAGALSSEDAVNGTHRGHHQFLAKALAYVGERSGEKLTLTVTAVEEELLHRTMAEILGLAPGFSGGRGGSMHLRWAEAGCLGTNAIVGGGVPLALGHAWAQRRDRGESPMDVTFTFFGDGASNIGSVLESMNLAAAWNLPVCFFIENNLYAVSTHVDEVTGESRLSARGPAFGMPAWRVDGMDPLAVKLAVDEALEHMRNGRGPVVIEAEVYRFFHQNGPFAGSAFGYRSKDEEARWKERDPLRLLESRLLERDPGLASVLEEFDAAVQQTLERIVGALTTTSGDGKNRIIRPELWPNAATVDVGIRSDARELSGLEPVRPEGEARTTRFVDAIAGVLARRMDEDPSIVVMGEDIHRLNGGTNGATKGLAARFADRTLGTPIAENAFSGLAGGLAMTGRYRPIVEFMFADFILVAADQLFNQIGKMRHMFGGDTPMPLVLRVKVATGSGYGSQHSMDPVSLFANFPGWRIVAPSTPQDYVAAMNAALALEDPVAVLEHTALYQTQGEVRDAQIDAYLPLRSARMVSTGERATVISYLATTPLVGSVVAEQGLDVDHIDLRWLDAASIDWETIGASVRKTNRVLIADMGTAANSYGAWLSHEIQSRFFDHLDHPVQRLTGREAAPTISLALERAAVPAADDVATALRSLLILSDADREDVL